MTAPAPRAPWPIGRVHWLGIATLYRREAKRYLRWWFEFITQPLVSTGLFVLVFHLALGPEGDEGAGEAAFTYLLPGLLIYSLLMQAAASTLYSLVFDKIEGALADILMPPLTPGEFAAGYLMSALSAAAATAAIVLPIVLLAGLGLPADPLTVAVFATLGCAELALCGIAIATVAKKWDQAEAFVSFGLTPAAFLSGVFAPVSALPDPLPAIIMLNPFHYIVDGFRAGYLGQHDNPVWLNLVVCLAVTAGMLGLCLSMLRRGVGIRA